ncbi:MAG: hypothetical protein HFJ06_01805 [Lachnospiraceae bacterium]|nr:hypothetical protein [Lachnospiraceae bacterium]
MTEQITAEKDILQFIDDAFCAAEAFGYGTRKKSKESEDAMDDLMKYLEASSMTDTQCYEVEPLASELARVSQDEGFKRGFSIALRIMIAGLNDNIA